MLVEIEIEIHFQLAVKRKMQIVLQLSCNSATMPRLNWTQSQGIVGLNGP
jgi:hypothetical protein